jgi:subtilisin family serine protease
MTGPAPTLTGRYLLVLDDSLVDDEEAAWDAVRAVTGGEPVAVFPGLGIAVVDRLPEDGAGPGVRVDDPRVLAVEPERRVRAISVDRAVEYIDTAELTWGLQATAVATSARTGRGTRVAVLDTGLDLGHPDFAGRAIQAKSFLTGVETVQDGLGHGTHCIGTAAGPLTPGEGRRRYGIAADTELFVGKVLTDAGTGTDATILAGISWGLESACTVVSLSLGANVREVSAVYEAVGRRALAAGTLIVAAAGNNADRSAGNPGFVGVPANSPSILAVGAVDQRLGIADFSAGSSGVDGGQVDLVGPGVAVYSAWPRPRLAATLSGTSMATPHVAGIAALVAEDTGATGSALWSQLTSSALGLGLPVSDVGAGLVQAPGASEEASL